MATKEDEKIEWDTRRLHKHSLEEIQAAIGKALHELTGKPYTVEIRSVDRHPKNEPMAALRDVIDLNLRVKEDVEAFGE